MQNFKKSFDHLVSEKPSQLILGIIFVFYILLNVHTPPILAGAIDNIFGKVLVVAIAAVIFMKTNPVIGVLGFVVAYQMIKTASVTTGTYAMKHFLPSESSKLQEMQSFNVQSPTDDDKSLEAEMVAKMAPLVMSGSGDSGSNYSPVLADQHAATPLHDI
jgi:hypothetical protein